MMIAMIKMNGVTIRNANLSPNLDEFAENFARMSVLSLMNYFSEYNNFLSHVESRDMTAIVILLNLLR